MILYEKAVLTPFCRPYYVSTWAPVRSGVVLRYWRAVYQSLNAPGACVCQCYYTIGLVDAVSLLRARTVQSLGTRLHV